MAPGPERQAELEKLYRSRRTEVDLLGDDLAGPSYVWMKLARVARAVGRTEEGVEYARRCIDLYHRLVGRPPNESVRSGAYYAAHVLLGEVALDQGDFDGACAH